MHNRICKVLKFTACAVFGFAIAAHAQSPFAVTPASGGTFVTFDIPGAGTHGNQGTIPRSMNPSGKATGYYIDDIGAFHGFSIGIDGSFATFDAPGGHNTQAYDIAPDGTIVGWYYDNNNVPHGFLRAPNPDNNFTLIDTPLDSINASGWTGGFQFDSNGAARAYVRSPDGVLTPFDVREAGTSRGQGTFVCPGCLNDSGVATGHYIDSNNVAHGFVRKADGTIEMFLDKPGEAGWASRINNNGQTCGFSFDANKATHGFIRNADGSIVPFDAPGAGTGSGQGTSTDSINNLGVVLGEYIDSANISHGYVRSADGLRYKILDAPGAGTRNGDGTQGAENNDLGLVVGDYIDNNKVYHGYYWVSLLP